MFNLYRILTRIAFAPVRKSSPIGLLFTHKNGDFGAIFVTERSCAAQISKVESRISDRSSYYTGYLFVSARKAIRCSENITLELN